jgi:hypothetical protein
MLFNPSKNFRSMYHDHKKPYTLLEIGENVYLAKDYIQKIQV